MTIVFANDPTHRALFDRALITWGPKDRSSDTVPVFGALLEMLLVGRAWEEVPVTVREAIEFAAENPSKKTEARAKLARSILENS